MRYVLALTLAVFIIGAALALSFASAKQNDQQTANRCTWTEVRLCYDGQNNGCCPRPKDKPQYDMPG